MEQVLEQELVEKVNEKVVKREEGLTPQPQRDLLERYFAEKILSLKHGLDEVYEVKANENGEILTQLQSLQAYWNIVRTEVGEIVDLFGSVNPATMNPNHRRIMKITKHYLPILDTLDLIKEKSKDSDKCCEFASTSIKYLSTIHACLNNNEKQITDKNKNELVNRFMEILPYASKQKEKRTRKKDTLVRQEGE